MIDAATDIPQTTPRADRLAHTRRNLLSAVATAIGSALIVGVLWLISRNAPSSRRDPAWPPPR